MIIIQEEIKVSEEWVEEKIKEYERSNSKWKMGFGDFYGGKDEIIKEIRNNTENGKIILMMKYKFENSDFYKEYLRKENEN